MIALIAGIVTLAPAQPAYVFSLAHSANTTVKLLVHNGTRASIELWSAGFWVNHRLSLSTAAGKPVGLTKLGETGLRMFGSLNRDKNVNIILKPGKSLSYETPPLDKVFTLRPGRYVLSVVYRDNSNGKPLQLSCKGIRIVVRP